MPYLDELTEAEIALLTPRQLEDLGRQLLAAGAAMIQEARVLAEYGPRMTTEGRTSIKDALVSFGRVRLQVRTEDEISGIEPKRREP